MLLKMAVFHSLQNKIQCTQSSSLVVLPYLPVSRLCHFPAVQTDNGPVSSHHQRSKINTAAVASHRRICASISLQSFNKLQEPTYHVYYQFNATQL